MPSKIHHQGQNPVTNLFLSKNYFLLIWISGPNFNHLNHFECKDSAKWQQLYETPLWKDMEYSIDKYRHHRENDLSRDEKKSRKNSEKQCKLGSQPNICLYFRERRSLSIHLAYCMSLFHVSMFEGGKMQLKDSGLRCDTQGVSARS